MISLQLGSKVYNSHFKGPATVQYSRQQLRCMGRNHIAMQVTKEAYVASRRERRKVAGELHRRSWQKRDKELIKKIVRGYTPNAQP